jgi:anti-sigma factor RsiW
MPEHRSERRRSGPLPALKVASCPCVADLLDFAEGRASPEDRRVVEAHLASTNCPSCHRWINQAKASASPSSSAAAIPPRVIADSPRWQRKAFADLEQRLKDQADC